MPQVLYILFGVLLTVGACIALGRAAIDAARARLGTSETWLFSFLLGAPLWSTWMLGLAAAGLVYKGVILVSGAAAIAWGIRRPWPRFEWPSRWAWFAVPFFVLYLANALAPEISPDGSSYHLGLVSRYYRERGFAGRYENMYAHLSQGMEMLFLSAWAFGRNSSAAMVHFAFQCALPLLMIGYGRRFGLPQAGLAAALVYFTPVVGKDGISAYNDVAGAAVVFGVFYLVEIHAKEASGRLPALIGILAGFAFAIKYTLGLAIPYAVARLAWQDRRLRGPAIAAACSLAIAGPWLVKNSIITGNPISPLFNAWFPNDYVTPVFEAGYRADMRHYNGMQYGELPIELTLRGDRPNGLLGPVWLLVPLALFAALDARGRSLLLAGLVFFATYPANVGARFLIPVMPFAALALGAAFARVPLLLAALVVAHGITSWPDIAKKYAAPNAWRLDRVFWKPALRIESEEGFLYRWLPSYSAARLIEAKVPPGDVVLTFGQEAEAYTTREIRTWYQSTANRILSETLHAPLRTDSRAQRRIEFTFPLQEASAVRVLQRDYAPAEWRVNELLIYANGHLVPRSAEWRLRASDNPAFVLEAFDGNPVTAWTAGQPLRPRQSMEASFPPTKIDRIVILTTERDASSRPRAEILVGNTWQPVMRGFRIYLAAPRLDMRRVAASALPRHGVQWLLVDNRDFGADDYYRNRREWGFELAGEAGGRKLYRIEDE